MKLFQLSVDGISSAVIDDLYYIPDVAIYYMSYSIIIKGRTSAKYTAKSIERERKLAKKTTTTNAQTHYDRGDDRR